MNVNQKSMKYEIWVDSTMLNNFHLIHKCDILRTKVPKLRSEVVGRVQKNSKIEN
jgi:hypothetical protein